MIDLSLKNRILTDYTAFLALELCDTDHDSKDLYDESLLVSVENTKEDSIKTDLDFGAFPNPFNTITNIHFSLPLEVQTSTVTQTIFNINGQIVRRFEIPVDRNKTKYTVKWNGLNEQNVQVSSGIYIALLKFDKLTKSIRLLYLK